MSSEARGLGIGVSDKTPVATAQQVLANVQRNYYTLLTGSGCGLTAGDRNGAVTRNTATLWIKDFQSLIQKRTGYTQAATKRKERNPVGTK